ncbi:MAG: efflux RND transporter periplasmic adaptor subunit [Acetobacteraceae bacterium]
MAVGILLLVRFPALAADVSPVPVQTAAARIQDVPVVLGGLGTVQPLNVVQIKAQVNGNLIALPAPEGSTVRAGDVLAEIDPRPYQAALDQALAQRDEDAALLHSAQLDLKRFQDLAKSQFAPVQQVDNQQATVNKLLAAIALDNAVVETARINLGYCVIKAPFDGQVGFYQVTVGNLVQVANATAILTLTQTSPISVVFTLPEAALSKVTAARAQGAVPVQALDNDGRMLAQGTLLTPNNMIDAATGTIALKATFPNQDSHLVAGQFVDARIEVETLRRAVTAPVAAINRGPDGAFTYVVDASGTARQVPVSVGLQWNGWQVITQGLAGDETLVVGGQSRLGPGMTVRATPAAADTAAPT